MDNQITNILIKNLQIDYSDVLPRHQKDISTQKERTDKNAEVFTPVSIVKKMNDDFDVNYNGSYLDYIKRTCLEATCGEAPFLASLYDASSGEEIPIGKRVGILDRKLKHIPENISKQEWVELANLALKSTYGFEWQEDSIFIARRNLLIDTIEHYVNRFNSEPDFETTKTWATIISYNIFRMDAITFCIPETDIPAKVMNWETNQLERFDGKVDEEGLW